MRKRDQVNLDAARVDELVEEIPVDANGEDEQLWAFRQAFEDNVSVPCEATVIGEPVKVMKFDYDGNNRRGLTAMCRQADGTNYVVAASDLLIPQSASAGRYLAACRKWMGLHHTRAVLAVEPCSRLPLRPQISTVPSNWWSCRLNRSLRAAACWAATEPSLSELAGSGT